MCIVCLLAALGSMLAVAPNLGDYNPAQIHEFARLIAPHLPADPAAAERAAERVAHLIQDEIVKQPAGGWRARVPVLRPNEARLVTRARTTAARVAGNLELARDAIDERARGEVGERIIVELARFYAALGAYPGDAANRRLIRAAAWGSLPLLGFALAGLGIYLDQFPELCGASGSLLGLHFGHGLIAFGAAAAMTPAAAALTERGEKMLRLLGAPATDRLAGAARAERAFWDELEKRWPGAGVNSARSLEIDGVSASLGAGCAKWLGAGEARGTQAWTG